MKIYLMRHGETELNIKKVYYGSTDCDLTAKGREQALALKESFPVLDYGTADIIVSPLKRAMTTAGLIFPGKDLKTDERIKELDFGDWEGKSWQELRGDSVYEAWCRDWKTVSPPGGESFEDMFSRTASFCRELIEKKEDTVIVAHKGILQALTVQLLGLKTDDLWHFDFEAGKYSLMEVTDGFGILKKHNA